MPNELKLAVKCPSCRHTRLQTLRQIKAQAKFTCHDCGYQATLRPDTQAHSAKQAVKELADAV